MNKGSFAAFGWGVQLSRLLMGVTLALSLVTCQGGDSSDPAGLEPEVVEGSEDSVGDAEDDAGGDDGGDDGGDSDWQDLLGDDLTEHWRGYKMEGLPAGWSLADGVLHFAPPEEGDRADLVTKKQYESFELALEWAVSPGGNSGIFFHVSEDHPATYHSGPEVQVLDDGGHRDGQSPLTSAGSNYALHPPSDQVVRPVGDYNEVLLRVEGDRVTHWLNGTRIVDYQLWTDEWRSLVAESKFNAMPAYGLNKTGFIALQDHGDEVWFRDLRIRELE